ncbi:MAG: hypothetical protein H3C54_08010 [Taibaiella sp.]|nr:hypothetical protein [Taibaiella sp.]
MKTFGIKTFYLQITLMAALIVYFMFSPNIAGIEIALGIPFAMSLGQLLYTPVIRISEDKMSIFTLFPFNKNINVPLSEVQRIIVEINYNMRFILHMKDGSIVSTICNRYAYDMKPLYRALYNTGVPVESDGIGTIDWVQPD